MIAAIDALVAALIIFGAALTLIGSIGLVRFQDFYARLHGPTKATTLGVGSLLLAAVISSAAHGEGLRLHKILITLFLFMTAPVSAHLLAKAGLRLKLDAGAAGDPDAEPEPRAAVSPLEAEAPNQGAPAKE